MGESLAKAKTQDDSGLDYSNLRAAKDNWVQRNLSVAVKRQMDALGVDPVKLNEKGKPDRAKFIEDQANLMRPQAQALRETLDKAPQAEVPEAVEARRGLDALIGSLDGPSPDITALRKQLGGLQTAVPLAVAAMAKALLGQERARLIQAAETLRDDVAKPGVVLAPDIEKVKSASEAVAKAMPEQTLTAETVQEGKRLLQVATELGTAAKKLYGEVIERRTKLVERSAAVSLRLEKIASDGIQAVADAAKLQERALLTVRVMTVPGVGQNETIEQAVKAAEDALPAAEKAVKPLLERKEKLGKKLAGAASPGDALKETVGILQTQREKAGRALDAKLSQKGLDLAEKEIDALIKQIGEVQSEGTELGGPEGLQLLLGPFGGDEAALLKAFGGRASLVALSAKMTPSGLMKLAGELGASDPKAGAQPLVALSKVFDPTALPGLATALGADKLAALAKKPGAKRLKEMCDAFTPALLGKLLAKTTDPGLPDKLLTGFGTNATALTRLTTKGGFDKKPDAFVTLVTKGCDSDPALFAKICKGITEKDDLPRLNKMLDKGGLGDAPDAFGSLVAGAFTGEGRQAAKEFKTLLASFGDDTACTDLKRVLDKAGLKGKPNGTGGFTIDPGILGQLLKSGHTADPPTPDVEGRCDALKTLLAGLDEGACGKLSTMLETTGLGAAPGAFAGVVGAGCNGDPAALGRFTTTFTQPANRTALERALTDGGLAGMTDSEGGTLIDPGCLGHMMRGGPAQDANGLAVLLKGLDKNACTQLQGVLSEGGLGQAPRGLGSLVGIGCEGKPASLKTFLATFDDTDSRAALSRGVLGAGLGGIEDADDSPLVDPSCLAEILKNGHKTPNPPLPAPNLATRCEGLKTLLTGLDDTACGSLRGLLEDGGLGTAPEAAGHVFGLGCDGDPDKLKALATEFGDKKGREKLQAAISKGGFGPVKEDGDETGVNPECLGRLLGTGCEGKPAELKKLFNQLSPTDLQNLEGVMTEGGLGTHPKVLAKLYKHGCLDRPNGADTGAKNPQVFKDVMTGFKGDDGPGAFKDMMDNGGLDTASGEDRLGSLVRYAFTPKRPSGTVHKQDAKKLRKLQESFDGNMAELKTMIDAISTAPGTMMPVNTLAKPGNQPGKGMQNICNAPRFNGNPDNLQAEFYTTLKDRAPPNPPPGHPARQSMVSLLQNAASFEHEPMGDGTEEIGGYEVRTGHVKTRHTRKYNNLDCNAYKPDTGTWVANKTTLYDYVEDVDTDVTERVQGVLNALGGAKPVVPGDMPGGFQQHYHIGDGKGMPTQIGFGVKLGAVAVTQFTPEQGTLLNSRDMKALGMALRTDRDAQVV